MATLKIYPGSTGMQESLVQIEKRIAGELHPKVGMASPREGLGMLAVEEEHQARGRRLGDLWTAKELIEAHLDTGFITQSLASGREELQRQGARRIKSCGWCWTRVTLRGGLVLKLESPYLRRSSASGKKKTSRGKTGVGMYPLLRSLGFELKMSPASRAEIARQTVLCSSYEEAREQLARQGLELDKASISRVAVHVGRKGLQLQDKSLRAARQAPLIEQSSLAGKVVRVGLDGGKARTRRTHRGRGIRPGKNGRRPFELDWQEPRVLTIDVLNEHGEVERSLKPVYQATLAKADGVMELVVGTLRLLGAHLAAKVVFVADGAQWIWRRIVQALLDEVEIPPEKLFLVLDYYHVTERISEALAACKDLKTQAREALREQLSLLLLQPHGAEQVIERLRCLARGRRARVINGASRYLHSRLHLMDYAELRHEYLSIGSGVVESAVRRVINLRFKAASMAWREDHLQPLLHLRAILKSGRWDQFFQSLLQGRHFLDPSTAFTPSCTPRRAAASRRRPAA